MAANIRALRERSPHDDALNKYRELEVLLSGDAVGRVSELCRSFAIPTLRSYGLTGGDIPGLIAKVAVTNSTKANPVVLSSAELTEIAERAL
jgi:alcohol dehydrogenase class IV